MFITLPKIKNNIVTLDKSRITLLDVDTEQNLLVYSLSYSIKQKPFILNNVSKVIISVYDEKFKSPNGSEIDENSTSMVIAKYLTIKKQAQTNYQKSNLLARIISNASLSIDDETRKSILLNPDFEVVKNKLVLKRASNIKNNSLKMPLLTSGRNENNDKINPQDISLRLLYGGNDPADVTIENNDNDSIKNNSSGTSKITTGKTNSGKSDYEMLLENSLNVSNKSKVITDLDDETLTVIKENVVDDSLGITETFAIPYDKVKFGTLYISLELLDERNVPITRVNLEKSNILEDIELFTTPKSRLNASYQKKYSGLQFQISNIDKNTQFIKIYSKAINKFSSNPFENDYQYVDDINVPMIKGLKSQEGGIKQEHINYSISANPTNLVLYRFIQQGYNQRLGSDFGSCVYKPKIPKQLSSGFSTIDLDGGVEVSVTNVPKNAVSYCITRKDTTIHEKFHKIISPFFLKSQNIRSYIDTEVIENHIYEYGARFVFGPPAGSDVTSVNTKLHKRIKSNINGAIDLRVSEPTITQNEQNQNNAEDMPTYNVVFSITTDLIQSTLDLVYNAFIENNVDSFFSNDVEERREQFTQLVAFKIFRENLTSISDIVEFDITFNSEFDDNENSIKAGVKFPVVGQNYRYKVVPYLRFSEDILEQLSSNNAKPLFKHDNAKYGNISTPETISKLYANDPFAFGQLGFYEVVNASYQQSNLTSLFKPNAIRYDKNHIIISWSTNPIQPSHHIDHYLIFRIDSIGKKTLIGRRHNLSTTNKYSYIHKITADDLGTVKYNIHAIYSNYGKFEDALTNELVVK